MLANQPQPSNLSVSQPTSLSIGDVLFYSGNEGSPLDRLIMARTSSPYVHVAVVLSPPPVWALIIQAQTGGVKIVPNLGAYSAFAPTGHALQTSNPQRFEQALTDLKKTVGDRYSLWDIANQALFWLPGHPTISVDRSYDCSHLAASFLQAAGYPFTFDVQTSQLSPGDLGRMLKPVPR